MNTKSRINLIIFMFALFWLLLLSRLYFISIKSNQYYEELATRNIIKNEYILPVRGEITDANNKPLAINKLGFSIYLSPHLRKKRNLDKYKKSINQIIKTFPHLKEESLKKIYQKYDTPYNHKPLEVVHFIPYDEMISKFVLFSNNKDISIKAISHRYYPQNDLASHIIGYVSKANQQDINKSQISKKIGVAGKSGIEKFYNSLLEGELGNKKIKVTALNKQIELLEENQPSSNRLKLTIDIRMQQYIKELFGNNTGAIIVMDAKNGSIIASGSYPEYDLNIFAHGISSKKWKEMINNLDHPFTNKVAQGLYPPGSSIKPLVSLSFLNSQNMNADEKFLCQGEVTLGDRKFRCWNKYGHGKVNMSRAIKESCDVYFYKGGLRVGIDQISTDLTRYGFGQKTFLDTSSEFIATVPSRNWKINKFGESWYKGETLNTVIGQGNFLVTPIQIAMGTALIATGKKVIPHYLYKVNDQNISFEPLEILNKKEKNSLPIIQKGMYKVANEKHGTFFKYNTSKITLAAKTGTSQVVGIPQKEKERMSEDDLKYYQKSHAWLTAYGPYKDPKYVVTVIIEHGGHGGKAAGQIVSDIFNKLTELDYITPKK